MKKVFVAILMVTCIAALAQQRQNPFADSLKKEKNQVAFEEKVEKYWSGSEQEMRAVYEYYSADRTKGDSLRHEIAKKYPLGYTSFLLWRDAVYEEKDPKKREEMYFKLKKGFPAQNFDEILAHVVSGYAEARNVVKVKQYLRQFSSSMMRNYEIQSVAETMMQYDLPSVKTIVKAEIDTIQKTSRFYMTLQDLYATIIIKEGNYAEALKYSKEAYESAKKSITFQRTYSFLLSKNAHHEEALPILQDLMESGFATPETKLVFRESYEKVNPGKDISIILGEIENHMIARAREEVIKQMISEAAPNFVLKDEKGNSVSLADFKGKTIVLDFWATWCVPCKKSFPAMQMAVNKYKDDPNVKFLFIHTWEHAPDPLNDAKKYLKSSHYTFDLYMDTKNPRTNVNEVVNAFGIKAIPAKFVIDGTGKIRFKMNGFNGGDDAAAAEVSAMIELAKK